MPQLPQLRLPHPLSQLFNQLSTSADAEDYSSDDSTLDNRCSCADEDCTNTKNDQQVKTKEDGAPVPFFVRFKQASSSIANRSRANDEDEDEEEDESSSDDDIEFIGRFIRPAAPKSPESKSRKLKKRKKKGSRKSKGKSASNDGNPQNSASTPANATSDSSGQWLIQKYFQQFNESWNAMRNGIGGGGEPAGILAAQEPSICPPIQPVRLTESSALSVGARASQLPSLLLGQGYNSSEYTSSSAPVQGADPSTSSHPTTGKSKKKTRRVVRKKMTPSRALGEQELRQRIKEIQSLELTDRDRDKRVQRLMTEQYYRITNLFPPEELYEEESEEDEEESGSQEDGQESEGELEEPSVSRKPVATLQDLAPTYFDADEEVLGCPHYKRGCKLECSTCYKWYTCRLCHDEVEGHKLIRPDTQNMLCMHCGLVQSVAQDCAGCHAQLARYYCSKCKLWDDDIEKSIYHCDDCGLCRIGEGLGKDFFHCQTCNVCMSIDLQDSHRCIEHSTECDCPICGEYMFTSTETVVFMLCGHSIHQSCYRQHTKTSYKCPTCARSIINMAAQFRILDTEIERQPMPEPYDRWRAIVVCNDCMAKSNVAFHFLGLKCTNCGSYNTAQHKIIKPNEDGNLMTDDEESVQQFGRNNSNSISWNMAVGSSYRIGVIDPPRTGGTAGTATTTTTGTQTIPELMIQPSEEYSVDPDFTGFTYTNEDDDSDDDDEIIPHSEVRLLHF